MTYKDPSSEVEANIESIIQFVKTCSGLEVLERNERELSICQTADNKTITFESSKVEKVISRIDSLGSPFIQINFAMDKKVLLTDTLVGFKPAQKQGLDMSHLPKVVTTPDLVGVIEALEDSLSNKVSAEDVESLRLLFYAVIEGAESIGFNLTNEKQWLKHLNRGNSTATA